MKTDDAQTAAAGRALDSIARDYGRFVSSVCRRMIQDEEIAKEAAQQVWVEVVKSFPSFRGESKVSTWIYTIARRVATDYAVRERTYTTRMIHEYSLKEEFDLPSDTDLEKAVWVKQMCDRCVTGVLHCLDNESRLALILKDIAGLPYEEIAVVLEKDAAAVRKMVSRDRRKLQSFMEERCVLLNDGGNCRCRMKRLVKEINLPEEYRKIRAIAGHVNFFKDSETILPRKNYWESLL